MAPSLCLRVSAARSWSQSFFDINFIMAPSPIPVKQKFFPEAGARDYRLIQEASYRFS